MRTAFERDGDIRSVDLAAAFATLWRQRATGVLSFSRPDRRVRFEILEGTIVGAFSSDASFDTAEVLIRAGKLDPSSLEGRRPTAGRDRARAAREQGLLTERDWRWGEKIRAVEIYADLLTWLEGRYSFDPGEIPGAGELSIGIERLLLELFLRSRDREFIHQSLGATDAPLQRAEDFDELFPGLGLTPDALVVVATIDGRATAAEISRRVPPDPFSVQKLLAALTTLGLVHPEYAAEVKKRPVAETPLPPAEPAPRRPEAEEEPEAPRPTRKGRERGKPPEATPTEPTPSESTEPAIEPEVGASSPASPAEAELLQPPPAEEPPPPIELPIDPVVERPEPQPAILGWEPAAPEPLDQALDLPEPPAFDLASRPGWSPIWILAALAVAVVALLVFRSRPAGNAPGGSRAPLVTPVGTVSPTETSVPTPGSSTGFPAAAAAPGQTPSPTATSIPSTPVPPTPVPPTPIPPTPIRPTATAPVPVPTAVPTRLPPTAAPAPLRPTPAATVAPASSDRRPWLERAARDREALAGDPRGYAIQLELVCELPSLEEALRYDRGRAMWFLASNHRGRECFRVLWGHYATLDEASSARAAAPRFFFTPKNRPVVVSTRALLP